MITLRADIEGSKQLSRRLMDIPDDIENWKVPLFRIGGEVRGSIDKNFSGRGSLFGRWVPRKDSKPHPLLEKTTTMRRNFKQNLGPDYIEIFNPTPYFKYHQSAKPRRVIPRRIMMKLDNDRKRFIVKEFQRHVEAQLKARS